MKRFAHKLFGKLPLGLFTICLQFGWLVYLAYYATMASSIVNLIFEIIAALVALNIVNRDMRTSFKLSWIFLILFLPVFGIPAYYIFGRSEITKRTKRKLLHVEEAYRPLRPQDEQVMQELYDQDYYAGMQSSYISNFAGYPLYREESSRYYESGEALFPQYLEDLEKAEHFIFMEYFIIENGEMFDAVLDILERKAKQGVLVRLIYDDVGCVNTLPPRYYKQLQAKGIHCACFNPFRPVMSVVMNNRDHRKIAVIDGYIGYTGGFNLADEYINKRERFGYWKDAGIRVTGECVWNFTTMFLEMWTYITKEAEDTSQYRPQNRRCDIKPASGEEPCGFIQPYSDSPMDRENVGENVYLNLIAHAKHYVYIFTPYLILGSEMTTALINAAKSGVDVRLVVPSIPDKKMVYLLTRSNYAPLARGGVKIYEYTPGFIHSKCFVVDDVYATVGTINLDYRSLYLHFECGTFMYRTKAVMQVKQDALDTFAKSREVTLEESEKHLLIVRMFFGVLKLLAPLL